MKNSLVKWFLTWLITFFLSINNLAYCQNEFKIIKTYPPNAHGFFAAFNVVLGHLELYDSGQFMHLAGIKVDFESSGLYYDSEHGTNWWEYYFAPISFGSCENAKISYFTIEERNQACAARRSLSRHGAFSLINKYIKVKQPILDKVEAFQSSNFSKTFTIGVHYRGTDKSKEAHRESYEKVASYVRQELALHGNQARLYVATDEAAFLEYFKALFPNQVIALDAIRSEDGYPIHKSKKDPYELGEQALMDALLLSRCDLLIRTVSHLSLVATYFNPLLPTILLNTYLSGRVE